MGTLEALSSPVIHVIKTIVLKSFDQNMPEFIVRFLKLLKRTLVTTVFLAIIVKLPGNMLRLR